MARSRYYGKNLGAIVDWNGKRVMCVTLRHIDRTIPEGADYTLRATPFRQIQNGKKLADHLLYLSIGYAREEIPAAVYMAEIDAAVKAADLH